MALRWEVDAPLRLGRGRVNDAYDKNPGGYCALKGTGISGSIGGSVQIPAH
jgi:hypothetical protein